MPDADPPPSDSPPADPQQPLLPSLVVVGSSAGGIEALSTLVSTLPAAFPVPIVLAQHLDPRHVSHLTEILSPRSTLPVRTVVEEQPLAPGVVYVVPSDRHVEITDHEVRLNQQGSKRPKPSIDLLLSSAAQVFGERLIAVILTGTGSDGASGAHAVKAAGGTVIIQNPATASYSSMPASLAPTTVDLIADLVDIGPLLYELVTGAVSPMRPDTAAPLQTLLDRVRERSGIDFSHYKRPTIERRLQRRMYATGHTQLTEYMRFLQSHPAEYTRLIASFLIKVTEFFRDADLFDELRERVVPDLITYARAHGRELRIWSAGCATGEEAYSLAILIAEALGDELSDFNVQIFATDLDDEAVAFARRGVYSAASVAGLSADLVTRYFVRMDGTYEVTKRLRGLIVFGQHDLGQRAPFPRIDLVLCRNVLIYFVPELQQRTLQLFAFALRDGGYLALGKAEHVKPVEPLFTRVASHVKLYRRRGGRTIAPVGRAMESGGQAQSQGRSNARQARTSAFDGLTEATHASRSPSESLGKLVMDLAVGVVVVDRNYDIRTINRSALRLFGIFTEALGKDLIHLTTSVPSTALRAAIDAAFLGQVPPETGSQTITMIATVLGERRQLQVTCYPRIPSTDAGAVGEAVPKGQRVSEVLLLVNDVSGQLREQQQAAEAATRHQAADDPIMPRTESELAQAYRAKVNEFEQLKVQAEQVSIVNRSLLEANQELIDTNVELRMANEELLVSHEEAEAATEEVKTLNEELQATNEELVTLNEEMEATVEELHVANDDLQARSVELQDLATSEVDERKLGEARRARLEAILLSVGDAVLVMDETGKPVLTNEAYTRTFGSPSTMSTALDVDGRPIPPQDTPQQRAARGEHFIMEFTLVAADDSRRYFEASGEPVRDFGSDNHGGVVIIRDITERSLFHLQNEFMANVGHELRTPLTAQYTALQMLERRLRETPADEQLKHHVSLALDSARQLRALVQDLMDMSRLRTGKFTLELAPVDLAAIARTATEAAQGMAAGQTIALKAPDKPVVVMGDAVRLDQVLMNLLTNAIKYAPGTKRIDVRLRQVDGSAELRVHDDGIGIAPEEMPHIFTRMFRSARARELESAGLGLGLFLTRDLVQAHGGTITVDSSPGQGATFTVRLPLAPTK